MPTERKGRGTGWIAKEGGKCSWQGRAALVTLVVVPIDRERAGPWFLQVIRKLRKLTKKRDLGQIGLR